MKILIIGGGGREHAMAWKIKQKHPAADLFFSDCNFGLEPLGQCIGIQDPLALSVFAAERGIDLTIVGPEQPLVAGIADIFQKKGLRIFGAHQRAAALEGDKAFAKSFMQRYGVATPASVCFETCEAALDYLRGAFFPVVIKASGLAQGKGVVICADEAAAQRTLSEIMRDKVFGAAGNKVLIEEFIEGFEASVIAFSNGKDLFCCPAVKDYKKIGEGDRGLNTGGMGAVLPHPSFLPAHWERFKAHILRPTQEGLRTENLSFFGCIFFGLMVDKKGKVYLLEYNMRMGDPETQALLPLMESDFLEVIENCLRGAPVSLRFASEAVVGVVVSAQGYPQAYPKGSPICGWEKIEADVFFAGVQNRQGVAISNGGRLLSVVARAADREHAREKVYQQLQHIDFAHKYFRRDIGC